MHTFLYEIVQSVTRFCESKKPFRLCVCQNIT